MPVMAMHAADYPPSLTASDPQALLLGRQYTLGMAMEHMGTDCM